ncbi:MAG TPA: LAGLIDADG family homing endonuclease [Chloroflexota bacterium]|nr:LAGLIDADG family homing endonuclease [Chloroflexota bacterium]
MARTTRSKADDQAPAMTEGTMLDGIRRKVFLDRYALKGEDGTALEQYPEQMWRRVARGIAAVEPTPDKRTEWEEKFYELLKDFKFVPGGRILSGAGTGHQVTYYNCYVVGLGENPLDPEAPAKPMLDPAAARPAFFSALAQMTDIMSRSGGVGMNLSALPPKGTPIEATGRGRRGAVRPTVALNLSHPDVERLIAEKDGPNLANVDVAVIVPPEFDQALADDGEWTPRWGQMSGPTVRAREMWARLTEGAGRPITLLRPGTATHVLDDSRDSIVEGAALAAESIFHGDAPIVDFTELRPKGAYIKTVNGTSSGPVAWMYLYDAVARSDDGLSPVEKGVIWFAEIASVITGKTIQQGGCFGPDQRIVTNKGLVRAAELAERIEAGESFSALTHAGLRPITYSFRNGIKPLFRVTTTRGFTVDVTAEHKMGVLRNGALTTIPLHELEIGDEVLLYLGEKVDATYVALDTAPYERSIMSTRLNEAVRLPDTLDEKLAYFLGYLHGDGYVYWGRKVTWQAPKAIKLATADAYPAIRDQLVTYARDLFGVEPVVEERPGEACKSVSLYSRVLIDWLRHNGLLKAHSKDVRVPEAIFRSPSSVMGAFVAGYFDADGCDRGRKNGYGFDSVSLSMLRDVQQLLAANGILSHIHTTNRSAQGWQTIHRLVVTGAEFKERMNLFMHMAGKNRGHAGFRNHHNGYSRDVWPQLGIPGRFYQRLWDSTKPRISYRALSRVQGRLVVAGEIALAERVSQLLHTVPDHIVSIEPLGPNDVYDFEVDDVHMLSGNGIYTSNSRRGALMIMLDDDHPDVEEFIAAKRIDPVTKRPVMIEHANMSLCISDAFMEAVKADLPWDLKWQGRVVRTVRARDIWDRICAAAWSTAEPGVVFMQRYQERSNTWYWENIRCVNPCVTGDTLIYTAAGLYPAAELAEMGTAVRVASPGEDGVAHRQASHVFATGVKPVYCLRTREGYTLRLTADHRVLTTTGWTEAQHLRQGDKIRLLDGEGGFGATGTAEMGQILGWLVGDGCINTNRGKGQPSVVLSFWGEDRALAPAFARAVNRLVAAPEGARQYHVGVTEIAGRDEARVSSVRLMRMIDPELLQSKFQVPASVQRGSREMQRGFLRALFSADGSVQGTQQKGVSVRLSSSHAVLLEGVQRLLLNFGIASTIYAHRRPEMARPMPDGKGGQKSYLSKAQHDLVISRANLPVFAEKIGFLQPHKQAALDGLLGRYRRAYNRESFVATFESLIPDGEEMVYDLFEQETHRFVANGLIIHNCGEQGLPPGGVCNLGALNVACYVDEDGHLMEDDLARDAAWATRFLDDVIDATPYFSELHVKMQREMTRRTGLGTMGLADALIKMRVAYGSAESLEVIDRIYRTIRDASYRASVELAEEKEPCGGWRKDPEKYAQGWFIKRLPQDVQAGIRAHGIRNGVLLTQAPTGTTSLLAGVSSGIEPVYDFAMKRVDRLGEHIMYHPLLQDWMDEHPGEERPAYFVGAKDLTPEEHILVQAKVQEYTDSSISKTSNAPYDHTVEDVKRLYTLAYDLGCKGVTYYRDGSRDAVLTSVAESKAAEAPRAEAAPAHIVAEAPAPASAAVPPPAASSAAQAPLPQIVAAPSMPAWMLEGRLKRRPKEMGGFTRSVAAPEGTVNITINSDADGPLEVFINVGRAGSDIAALAEALGRLISLQLRLPSTMSQEERLRQVANQLRGIGGSRSIGFGKERVQSLPDAVARAIYHHLEEHPATASHPEPAVPAAQLALPVSETLPAPAAPATGPFAPSVSSVPTSTSGATSASAMGTPVNGKAQGKAELMQSTARPVLTGNLCPQCGSGGAYVYEEGCKKCHYCGYSEC